MNSRSQQFTQIPRSSGARELDVPGYETRFRYKNESASRQQLPLDVASFLMSAEIERLIRENTQLKQEVQNYIDSGLDRVNYEMQIRDLMEKLRNQTQQIDLLTLDNQKLVAIIRDLENQLRRLEDQLRDYNPDWRQSLRDLEKQLQAQQRAFGGKSPEDIQKELEDLRRKAKLLDDVQKKCGGRNVDDLLRELEALRKKNEQAEDQNRKLQLKVGDLEKEGDQLKKKAKQFDDLAAQFSNPNDIARELEALRRKAADLDKLNKSLGGSSPDQLQRNLDELKKLLGQKDRELAELRRTLAEINDERGQSDLDAKRMQQKIDELEEKVVGLAQELSRCKMLLKSKDEEIERLKNLLRELERQISTLNGDLQKSKQDLLRIQQECQTLRQDNSNLKRQGDELKRQNQQLQSENNQLHNENESLQQDLDHQQGNAGKVDELQDKIGDLSSANQQLNVQVNTLNSQLMGKTKEIDDLKKQLQDALNRVKQLEDKLKEMDAYIDTLEADLERFEREVATLNQAAARGEDLESELDRLNQLLDKLRRDNDALARDLDRTADALNQSRALQDELARAKEDLARANNLIAQQEREIKAKEMELQTLVMEFKELQIQNQELSEQNAMFKNELDKQEMLSTHSQDEVGKMRRVIEEYKERLRLMELKFKEYAQLEERLKQSDHRIAVLMTEIERLNQLVKSVQGEAEEWKQNHARLELALLEYRQIEKTNRDAASRNQALLAEIERLKKLLEQKHLELLQVTESYTLIQSQISTMEERMSEAQQKSNNSEGVLLKYLLLAAENERLGAQVGRLQSIQEQFNELSKRHSELSEKCKGMNPDEFERMRKQLMEYENKIAMLSLEVQRLKHQTQNFSGNQDGYGYEDETYQYDYQHSQHRQLGQGGDLSEEDWQKRINDLLCLIVMMSAELDNLRDQVQSQQPYSAQTSQRVVSQTVTSQVTGSAFTYQRVSSRR